METVQSCNATYGLDIATTYCVVRRDGEMMIGLVTSMTEYLGLSTKESEDR